MGSVSQSWYPPTPAPASGASASAALSTTPPSPAASFQQIQAPAGGYDNSAMVDSLAGGIKSRNDAAANQQIGGAARAMGGDTTSPAFQFLAGMAKTGAAGNTGSQVANLKFQAANTAQSMDLQRQTSNQSAANQAQSIANSFAQNQSAQALQNSQFNASLANNSNQFAATQAQQAAQFQQSFPLQQANAASKFGPSTGWGQNMLNFIGAPSSNQASGGPGTVNYSS